MVTGVLIQQALLLLVALLPQERIYTEAACCSILCIGEVDNLVSALFDSLIGAVDHGALSAARGVVRLLIILLLTCIIQCLGSVDVELCLGVVTLVHVAWCAFLRCIVIYCNSGVFGLDENHHIVKFVIVPYCLLLVVNRCCSGTCDVIFNTVILV